MQINGQAILTLLKYKDLAEFLGTTRLSIIQSMNKLQSRKLVEYSKTGEIILRISEISRLNYKI